MCRNMWSEGRSNGAKFFSVTSSDRTRCSGKKLKYRRYHLIEDKTVSQ